MRVFYENLIVFCYLHTNKNGVVILKDFSKHEKTFQEAMKNIERSYSDMDNHFQKFVARNKNIKATLFKDTYALYSHYVHFSHHNIYNNISRTEKTG